jgi:hypothetical protein
LPANQKHQHHHGQCHGQGESLKDPITDATGRRQLPGNGILSEPGGCYRDSHLFAELRSRPGLTSSGRNISGNELEFDFVDSL